tara:strand:- start:13833 stop:14645 length:813 start_codon:yes stop_codon:yes gene_type:complete
MRAIYIIILSVFAFGHAYAQSGQYKRVQKKAKEAAKKSGKIDIQNLEKQYWTPQDTEFKVVQNRKYSKKGRLGVSLQFGLQGNDPYTESFGSLSATFAYYWSEFHGAEFTYTDFNSEDSEIIDRFRGQFGGTTPNFALLDTYYGFNYNYVPIYGKMSVLDSNIIYFDLAISPGIGMTNYLPQLDNGELDESTVTFSLDVSQHFFFANGWAIRLDMKNRAYTEDRYKYSDGSSQGDSDRLVTTWQLGLTYYFDVLGAKKEAEKKLNKKGKK